MDATTRDTILDAAERLFARQGYAATSIKAIGTEAGVNPALLYYYFTDKDALYRETLRRAIGAMIESASARLGDSADPAGQIRAFVVSQAGYLATHPNLSRLMMRELVDHEAAHAVEQITALSTTVFARLCELIRLGQQHGRFRPELDPAFAAVSTVAVVVHFFTARPAVARLLGYGADGIPADVIEAYGRHAADYALAALLVPAPHPVAPRARRR